jgi:autotransporter-associated beta strand protein
MNIMVDLSKTKLLGAIGAALFGCVHVLVGQTTVSQDFEGATGDIPPTGWAVIGAGANGSYTNASATGNPGVSANLDWTGSNQLAPGVYITYTNVSFDASKSISGSFDFYVNEEGNYSSANFIFGDVKDGLAGTTAGEFINAYLNEIQFGQRARVYDSAGTVLFNGDGNNNYEINTSAWMTNAVFTWNPTNGITGDFSFSWETATGQEKGPMTVTGYTFDEKKAFLGFGTGDVAARFDNISLSGTVFTVESVPPEVANITNDVAGAASTFIPFTYTVTFNEDVKPSTVSPDDFYNAVSSGAAPIVVDSVSSSSLSNYVVTVTPSGTGDIVLGVSTNILDFSDNPASSVSTDDETVTVNLDVLPPEVTSITSDRDTALTISTNTPITYTITFDAPMNSNTIESVDFGNAASSTFAIDAVTAIDDLSFTVVAKPTSAGTFQLQLLDASVEDATGNLNSGATNDVETFTVLGISPGNGTWSVDESGDWGDPTKWASSQIANGTDNTAIFSNNLSATRTITLDRDITIGHIDFQETGQDLVISGSQTLTLDVTSGAPEVSISNRTLTISSTIAGSDGLSKTGGGTLNLSGNNTFSGEVDINGGTVNFSSLSGWGISGKNVTFSGNGTITSGSMSDEYTGDTLSISSGVIGIIQRSVRATFPTTTGAGKLIYGGTGSATVGLNIGDASGFTGDVMLSTRYGSNPRPLLVFSNVADTANSAFQVGGGQGDSNQRVYLSYAGTNTLILNNRQIAFIPRENSNWSARGLHLQNNSAATSSKWVINSDLLNTTDRSGGNPHELVLEGSNTNNNEFAGAIGDSTFITCPLHIIKDGEGKWILSGQNTYSGITTVSKGTLVLKGEAAIADANTVNITGGKLELIDRERVGALQFNGATSNPATGTWGATGSGADNINDTYFTGSGVLYVGVDFPPTGTVLILK